MCFTIKGISSDAYRTNQLANEKLYSIAFNATNGTNKPNTYKEQMEKIKDKYRTRYSTSSSTSASVPPAKKVKMMLLRVTPVGKILTFWNIE